MSDFEDSLLLNVAVTIADGLPVDWEALGTAYPELGDEFQRLRLLESVSQRSRPEPESGSKHNG